jgi:hypothetical protein
LDVGGHHFISCTDLLFPGAFSVAITVLVGR